MTEIILPRRKFLIGMAGLLAAPAIVRIESLMPVRSVLAEEDVFGINFGGNELMTINMITRESLKLFRNTNLFLQDMNIIQYNSFRINIKNG